MVRCVYCVCVCVGACVRAYACVLNIVPIYTLGKFKLCQLSNYWESLTNQLLRTCISRTHWWVQKVKIIDNLQDIAEVSVNISRSTEKTECRKVWKYRYYSDASKKLLGCLSEKFQGFATLISTWEFLIFQLTKELYNVFMILKSH